MNVTSNGFSDPAVNGGGVNTRGQYRATVDVDQARRQREATTIQIRKNKREERLNRRRKVGSSPWNPSGVPGSAEALPEASSIPNMVKGLMSPNVEDQKKYATMFRRLLSIERNPPIELVINAGVVPKFVEFLKRFDQPGLQFEAAWALTNIASGTSDHTNVVIQHGAVPIFVQLLASGSDEVREQAVWALGNVAGDSASCRNLVLEAGALTELLKQLNSNSKITMLRNATWTLSNFCRGKPQPKFEIVRDALPALATLVYMNDVEVLTDSCWALSYLSDGTNDKIQAVIDIGVVPRCVELLGHSDVSVQTPALRTVGNIVTGDDNQTQSVLKTNALQYLMNLLGSDKKGIRKEACWTLSNITAGNAEQIQTVVDANIFPVLINMLSTEQFEIQKEAAWAVSNATAGGTVNQIMYLIKSGCVKPLCDLLTVPDSKILLVALVGVENVLKAGAENSDSPNQMNEIAVLVEEFGGVDKIEQLQQHKEQAIYSKAARILTTYYTAENDNAEVVPASSGAQFGFGLGQKGPGSQQQTGFNFSS